MTWARWQQVINSRPTPREHATFAVAFADGACAIAIDNLWVTFAVITAISLVGAFVRDCIWPNGAAA